MLARGDDGRLPVTATLSPRDARRVWRACPLCRSAGGVPLGGREVRGKWYARTTGRGIRVWGSVAPWGERNRQNAMRVTEIREVAQLTGDAAPRAKDQRKTRGRGDVEVGDVDEGGNVAWRSRDNHKAKRNELGSYTNQNNGMTTTRGVTGRESQGTARRGQNEHLGRSRNSERGGT